MDGDIIQCAALTLCGVRGLLRASATSALDRGRIAELWQQVRANGGQLRTRIGESRYAIITGDLPTAREDQAFYYALVAVEDVTEIPDAWITYSVPAGRVAKFIHTGPARSLGSTVQRIFAEWLPNSGESIRENLELMVLPPGYNPTDPEAQLEYRLLV